MADDTPAKNYEVLLTRADGASGDTVTVSAIDEDGARKAALKSEAAGEHDDWTIESVIEL
jgi:hypothetical protein